MAGMNECFMVESRNGGRKWHGMRDISTPGIDARDFCPLQTQARHQAALIEEKGISPAVDSGGGQGCGHATIDDDEARAAAELPAIGAVEIADGGFIHKEERVAESLYSGLQAPGGGGRLVKPRDAAVAEQPFPA